MELFKIMNLQGGVTLVNELLGTPKSPRRTTLIGQIVAGMLEDLPAEVFTVVIDGEINGEPEETDSSENTWNWSQVEEFLRQRKEEYGF